MTPLLLISFILGILVGSIISTLQQCKHLRLLSERLALDARRNFDSEQAKPSGSTPPKPWP